MTAVSRPVDLDDLRDRSKSEVKKLLSRRFGNAPREDTFRPARKKMKAKDRRALQRGRAGMKLKESQEEYNKNKRIAHEERNKRRRKVTNHKRGFARRIQYGRRIR